MTMLERFINHVEETVQEHMDAIDSGKEYDEKFDIVVKLKNRSYHIPLHADSYMALIKLLETEEE